MANADSPSGARPVRHINGSTAIPSNSYSVDSSNSTAIFIGDFIIREADGNVAPYSVTTGGNLLGVCVGVEDGYDNLTQRYLAASTAGNIMVADDPDLIFEIQEDSGGTALTSAARGANCDVVANAGSTSTSMSAHEIDQSQITAAVAQLRLHRIVPREDNAYGEHAKWEVMINEHELRSVDLTGI